MKVLPMAQVAAFKNNDRCKKIQMIILLTKTSPTSMYFSAQIIFHIMLENDNTVLIKGLKGSNIGSKHASYKTSYDEF